jgi:hypothetical protein
MCRTSLPKVSYNLHVVAECVPGTTMVLEALVQAIYSLIMLCIPRLGLQSDSHYSSCRSHDRV